MGKEQNSRQANIEVIRFVFSSIIVYFHILHNNIISFTNNSERYRVLAEKSSRQYILVEFFLIAGGYFLYQQAEKKKDTPFSALAADRFVRIWPVLAAQTMAYFVITRGNLPLAPFVMDLALLRGTGIAMTNIGIIWYIGPFFWGSLFILGIHRAFDSKKAALLVALTAYLGYAINLNMAQGNVGREIVLNVVSLGMLRVLAGLSLGYLAAAFMKSFGTAFPRQAENSNNYCKTETIVFTIAELLLGVLLGVLLFTCRLRSLSAEIFTVILVLVVFFLVLIQNKGLFSRICEKLKLGFLGKYAYSIYVMQQLAFDVLKNTIWRKTDFVVEHPAACLAVSLVFSIAAGIATYYVIESPATKLYRKWKNRRNPG